LPKLTCTRCGHVWIPRIPRKPKQCPNCRSPYWNKPKWKGVKKNASYPLTSEIDIASVGSYKVLITDENGFQSRNIKHREKMAGYSGRKSLEWIDVNRTSDKKTIIDHVVKEQSQDGQWELVHRDIKKATAKRRPKKGKYK